jgi:hypothetical protein
LKDIQQAAHALGWQIQILNASTERDFELAFASLVRQGASALLIARDTFFAS